MVVGFFSLILCSRFMTRDATPHKHRAYLTENMQRWKLEHVKSELCVFDILQNNVTYSVTTSDLMCRLFFEVIKLALGE